MIAGKSGVTANSPKNVLFGAGTIHKGLKYTTETGWNFDSTCVGATSGGSKLSIVPEIYDIPFDGPGVLHKGQRVKTGEKATLEINLIELTKDIIAASTLGEVSAESDVEGWDVIVSKEDIVEGDYWESIGFVGKTLAGKKVIAILENAMITSGFEQDGKNKEGAVGKYTFECHADEDTDENKLPWKIYYPKASA